MTPAKMLVTSTLVYIFLQTCYLRICFTRSEDIERWNTMDLCRKAIRVFNGDIKFVVRLRILTAHPHFWKQKEEIMNGNFKHLNNIIHSTQSSFFLRFVHMFVKYIKYVNNYLLLCDFLITDLNFISVSFKLQKLCILRYIYIIIKIISMCVYGCYYFQFCLSVLNLLANSYKLMNR